MIISFNTKDIRQLCEDLDYAKQKLGNKSSNLLFARISDLLSSKTLGDSPTFFIRKIEDKIIEIEIDEDYVLKCLPLLNSSQTKANGFFLDNISRLKILSLNLRNE